MSGLLKVGVVGLGVGAGHIEAYRELDHLFSVNALCDIDAKRAGEVANKFGVATVVSVLDALLRLDVDIVDICTPSALHFTQSKAALLAGRHVVVEKPFASSLAEADALAEVEAGSGKRVSPIFQYRFGRGIAQFLRLRAEGFVVKTYAATVETHWRRLPAYYANPWRGRWATELGGCLTTHAIHNHDLLIHVLGPVASVYARTSTRVNPIETEDCAAAVLEMADGSFATLSVTLGAEEDMSRLRFCFEGLTVESGRSAYNPGEAPWRFIAADPARQSAIDEIVAGVPSGPERYAGQFLRLHHALTEGGQLPVSIADARPSLELLTAAYHSARHNEPVRLPLGPDHPGYSGWLPPEPQERA
jgi:predicted dehydrogenase